EAAVGLYAPAGIADAGGVESEAVDIGAAAGGNQQVAAVNLFRRAVVGDLDANPGAERRHPHHGDGRTHDHAFAADRLERHARELRLVLGQRLTHVDNRDLRTQTPVCLGQFHADRPGADDDQVSGQLDEVEHSLVGEKGYPVQAL